VHEAKESEPAQTPDWTGSILRLSDRQGQVFVPFDAVPKAKASATNGTHAMNSSCRAFDYPP